MEIKYSPYFIGDCYEAIPMGKSLMGHAVVSNTALLELFELRLGLPSFNPSKNARAIEYRKALGLKKTGAFYEASFDRDPLGTSTSILEWRDTMLMALWDPAHKWTSPRLYALADVEVNFNAAAFPGEADRWLRVKSAMAGRIPFDAASDKIEVYVAKDIIPPLIAAILN